MEDVSQVFISTDILPYLCSTYQWLCLGVISAFPFVFTATLSRSSLTSNKHFHQDLELALYLYRKFIEDNNNSKAPTGHEPCIHQRNSSLAPEAGLMSEGNGLDDFTPKEVEKNHQLTHDKTTECDICKDEKRQMNHY
jgi:hypothetical protein